MKRILTMNAVPCSANAGWLVLRIALGMTLFLRHGTEKLFHFSQMAAHFPNPLHFGPAPSLVLAMLSDGICSLLIVLGLATRWAALWSFVNIFIAWALVHHFPFFGRTGEHGEVMVLYLAGLAAIFIAGAGRFSIDSLLTRGSRKVTVRRQVV